MGRAQPMTPTRLHHAGTVRTRVLTEMDHLLSEIKVAAMVHVRHREPPFCQSWFVTFRPSQTYKATKTGSLSTMLRMNTV